MELSNAPRGSSSIHSLETSSQPSPLPSSFVRFLYLFTISFFCSFPTLTQSYPNVLFSYRSATSSLLKLACWRRSPPLVFHSSFSPRSPICHSSPSRSICSSSFCFPLSGCFVSPRHHSHDSEPVATFSVSRCPCNNGRGCLTLASLDDVTIFPDPALLLGRPSPLTPASQPPRVFSLSTVHLPL